MTRRAISPMVSRIRTDLSINRLHEDQTDPPPTEISLDRPDEHRIWRSTIDHADNRSIAQVALEIPSSGVCLAVPPALANTIRPIDETDNVVRLMYLPTRTLPVDECVPHAARWSATISNAERRVLASPIIRPNARFLDWCAEVALTSSLVNIARLRWIDDAVVPEARYR